MPGTLNIQQSNQVGSKGDYPFIVDEIHLHFLTSLRLHLTILLQANGRHIDEAGSLGGREVTNLIHAGLGHVVQLLGLGRAAQNRDRALVRAAADLAVHRLLRSSDGGLKELALGGEVKTVVEEL